MTDVMHQISIHLSAVSRLSLSNELRVIADRLDDGTIKKGSPVSGATAFQSCSIVYDTNRRA